MLIHGNPRAEQTEPRIRSARFGIGRDETEHRPTLLGRTEIETEHPLAPRDESEQYSISVRSVRSQACTRCEAKGILGEILLTKDTSWLTNLQQMVYCLLMMRTQ